ncbi:MAG: pyruvate dehydrogenase (acetyl-transferring) E1 component subunit alpha [Thermoleophilaceae bacterium]|nr:pyruvate dehydrogenase (acetyl-transferring) E1 component subunit alpha [Thermoleophilaceae bacterium]
MARRKQAKGSEDGRGESGGSEAEPEDRDEPSDGQRQEPGGAAGGHIAPDHFEDAGSPVGPESQISPSADRLRELYETMVLIRLFEEETERQYKKARIGGYCHLSSGQEAVAVGGLEPLGQDDILVSAYRCHHLALARGISPESVMAELFGRADGCAGGRGGSMHLADPTRGYLGGWGIVAGHVPLATGAAFTFAQTDQPHAVLCELGEGAVNEGAWHEALNLAGLLQLPVVYLVENNIYGMGTSVHMASAEPEVWKRVGAFAMHAERIDGQDLEAVMEASDRLLRRAREERLPALLECITYRYRGHSVADAGTAYRTEEEIEEWKGNDPISRFGQILRDRGIVESDEELDEVRERMDARVQEAVEFAENADPPELDSLARHVYGDEHAGEQFARMTPGSPFGERELVLEKELGDG